MEEPPENEVQGADVEPGVLDDDEFYPNSAVASEPEPCVASRSAGGPTEQFAPGGSGSSREGAMPPALVAPDRPPAPSDGASSAPSRGGPRSRAAAQLFVPGEKLSLYSRSGIVEAVCGNMDHGKCVLTRKMCADQRLRNPA